MVLDVKITLYPRNLKLVKLQKIILFFDFMQFIVKLRSYCGRKYLFEKKCYWKTDSLAFPCFKTAIKTEEQWVEYV